MAGLGNALGKFTEGLVTGFATSKKNQREQEIHDAQMQKIRDEQAMNAEIKKLNETTVKPVESYLVRGDDGTSTAYTDAAMAHDAAANNPGAQVEKKITVAGKHYDTMDEAQTATELANSPIAKMRIAGDIAMKFNRPDIAAEYAKAYKVRVDQNRQDAGQTILNAAQAGDTDALLKAYNERLPNGRKAEMVAGDNGQVGIQITSGGKPVGQPQMFANPAALFENAYKTVGMTPDNAFEVWQHTQNLNNQSRGLDLQARGVAVQEKTGAANVAQTEAQTAQMPAELALKKIQAAASATSAGAAATGAAASATNAATAAYEARKPKVYTGVDGQNNVVFNQAAQVQDPDTGKWGLNLTPSQTVPGMLPTGLAKPDPFGLNKPQKTDAQRLEELRAAFPQPTK